MSVHNGTINDENDGRGFFLYMHGFVFAILHDDGTLSFEGDDPDVCGTVFVKE